MTIFLPSDPDTFQCRIEELSTLQLGYINIIIDFDKFILHYVVHYQFQICKINWSFLTINPYLRYQVSVLKITKSGKNIYIGTINTCFIQLSSITDFLHRYNIYRGPHFS